MKPFKNVDEYIENTPEDMRGKLKKLRAAIREAAPGALEKISYGMPYYGFRGRLAYFRLQATHIGLYIPPPVIEEHKEELKKYGTSVSTVRFPLDEELPLALIKKLVRARVRKNDESGKKK